MADEMRIDDLARAAGVASTTIRLYQRKGLLAGPRLEGRTGWYGPAHLDRLRVIARLQDEGHSLAGIGRLVERWEAGGALADLVTPDGVVADLLGAGREVVLTPEELAERLPAEGLTPEAMVRAADLGLVALTDDGRIRILDTRFLDIGPSLAELGLPVEVILDEWDRLRATTDEMADRFVALFEAHLLPDGVGPDDLATLSADELTALADRLGRLRRLAGQVVQASLDASLARRTRDRLDVVTADARATPS